MKTKRGFTVLELLVVMGVFAIMSAAIIVSLNSSRATRQVETAGRDLMGVLREAQNGALTGAKVSGRYPCQYSVSQQSSTSYKLSYRANTVPGETDCTGDSVDMYAKSLPNGTTVNAFTVNFSVPWGASSSQTIQVRSTSSSACYEVRVNNAGNISGFSC